MEKIVKSDEEWREQLTREEFEITRRDGTERAFSGKYWNLHDKGIYLCVCCGNVLFDADAKYDSGSGWPSFWRAVAEDHIKESEDASLGMKRISVSCSRCGAHLGHVFEDGPQPTGLRYCMNSGALRFQAGDKG